MKTTLQFRFIQSLKTVYPGLLTTVSFEGRAGLVTGEAFAILNMLYSVGDSFYSLTIPQGFDDQETLELQQSATGEMGKFLALCRNIAHQEATELGWFDTVHPNLRKPIMRQELSEL